MKIRKSYKLFRNLWSQCEFANKFAFLKFIRHTYIVWVLAIINAKACLQLRELLDFIWQEFKSRKCIELHFCRKSLFSNDLLLLHGMHICSASVKWNLFDSLYLEIVKDLNSSTNYKIEPVFLLMVILKKRKTCKFLLLWMFLFLKEIY